MRRRNAALFFAFAFAAPLGACVPEDAPSSPASSAEVERLFDDALEPPTVGITLGAYEALETETPRARARLAEAVFRAQVTSILPITDGVSTADATLGAGIGWMVELTTKEVLRGADVAPKKLEVEARAGTPSASLVTNFRSSFERAHLLVFARRYARPNERVRWHVHTVADTAEAREMLVRSPR